MILQVIVRRRENQERTGPDHGLDHGLDRGSDHRLDHGSDHRKKKVLKKKNNQIVYKIIINKK